MKKLLLYGGILYKFPILMNEPIKDIIKLTDLSSIQVEEIVIYFGMFTLFVDLFHASALKRSYQKVRSINNRRP